MQLGDIAGSDRQDGSGFHRVLEKLPVAGYTCDAQGLITCFNERAARLWGREPKLNDPADRFCGSFRLFSPDGEPMRHDESSMARALREGRQYEGHEVIIEAHDGSRRIASAHANPIHDEQGRVIGAVNILVDITDHKQTETRLREETRITETLHRIGGLLAAELDMDKLVQLVTDEATGLTGAQFGAFFYNVTGDGGERYTLYSLSGVPREAFAQFPMPRNTAIFGPTFRGEGAIRLDDVTEDRRYGKSAPYHGMPEGHLPVKSYMAVPVVSRSGEVLGGLFFGHSRVGRFTERHENLAVGIASQAAIAIDNARLYQQAREQARQLQDADRRKDEFLAMLAHELRNPLAPIRTGLDVLALNAGEHRETLHVMQDQVKHLVRLVDDLLDASRIMRGKVELRAEPVELSSLVERSVKVVQPMIEERAQELAVVLPEQPVWLDADPVRLVQVIDNLLNNASKYTDVGGRIELKATSAAGHVVLRVQDTGVGIEPELLPRVFDLFTQSDRSLDRAQGGLGIGLTLVKRLVELQGGTVSAHSDGRGRGSTFAVRLPVTDAAAPSEPESEPRASIAGRRVVVVDDNRGAAWMLSTLLRKLGDHEVVIAYDGPSAIEKIERIRPEIVLLDIGLPGMDGYDVAKRVRKMPEMQQTLLVALTGYSQPEDRQKSQQAGFDQHLTKPPSLEQIQALLVHPRLTPATR